MKRKILLTLFGSLSLFSYSTLQMAQSQAISFPEEVICKSIQNAGGAFGKVVGETYHPTCSGEGNNAWITKFLSDEEWICTIQAQNFQINWMVWRGEILQGYDIIDEKWSATCPPAFAGELNMKKVKLKNYTNPYYDPYSNPPIGYVSTRVSNELGTIMHIGIPNKRSMEVCKSIAQGYVQKGHHIYLESCHYGNDIYSGYNNSLNIVIPEDIEIEVQMQGVAGFPASHIVSRNYLSTKNIPIQNGQLYLSTGSFSDIKRPIEIYEKACPSTYYGTPTGYRLIGIRFDNECDPYFPSPAYILKKIGDEQEIMCTQPTNYDGQTIPITYSKVDDIYVEDCPSAGVDMTTGLYNSNAILMRQITDF